MRTYRVEAHGSDDDGWILEIRNVGQARCNEMYEITDVARALISSTTDEEYRIILRFT